MAAMIKYLTSTIICFCLIAIQSGPCLAQEKITWFKSGTDSRFWPIVEQVMVSAAADLDIELTIVSFKNDPFYMLARLKEIVEDPNTRPDCIITHNYKKKGKDFINLSGDFDVPVLIFNAGFSDEEDAGVPRGKFPNWIGQILPDDEQGGYQLAKDLIAMAKTLESNNSGTIEMVALEGNRASDASNKRVVGLKRALAEHPEVVNNQFFHVKWKMDRASEAYRAAMKRYPDTTIFWAASEDMAIGVIKAAKEDGFKPGRDIVTGGFDLLPVNRAYVESGEMSVSIGAHYFEAAWALILAHDYLKGIDFDVDSGGTFQFTSEMTTQSKKDFATYRDIYTTLSGSSLDKLDFKTLSKYYNPQRDQYDFSLLSFLKSAE